MDSIEDLFAQHVDPRGAKGEPSDDMAIARRMPIAALVAVLAEQGEPGDVTAEELAEVERLDAFETAHRHDMMSGPDNMSATWRLRCLAPRLAREVVILRAVAAHVLPCGHDLADIVYGGPDLNGLPAVAQCGQCLADRQAAKAALPRTPETVLRAMLRAYEAAAMDATVGFFRALKVGEGTSDFSASVIDWQSRREIVFDTLAATLAGAEEDRERVLSILSLVRADYEARLAGTRPLDAPPPEAP